MFTYFAAGKMAARRAKKSRTRTAMDEIVIATLILSLLSLLFIPHSSHFSSVIFTVFGRSELDTEKFTDEMRARQGGRRNHVVYNGADWFHIVRFLRKVNKYLYFKAE